MVRRVNLLPASERRRTETDIGLLVVIAATIVVVGGLVFSLVYLTGVRSDRGDQLEALRLQNQQLQQQVAGFTEYEALQSDRVKLEQVVQTVYAGRTLISDIVGDISLVVPDNVWFQSLSISSPDLPSTATPGAKTTAAAGPAEGSLMVEGKTYAFEDVATFLVRLEQIPSLKDIVLTSAKSDSSEQNTQQVRTFSITSKVVNKTQSPDTPLPVTQLEAEDR